MTNKFNVISELYDEEADFDLYWAKIAEREAANEPDYAIELAYTERLDGDWLENELAFREWAETGVITDEKLRYQHSFNDKLKEKLSIPPDPDSQESPENREEQHKFILTLMKMNDRYALIGPKASIVDFSIKENRNTQTMSPRDFEVFMRNQPVRTTEKKRKTWADVWMESPHRRDYRSMMFRPNKGHDEIRSVYNTWTGWAVEPKTYNSRTEYTKEFARLVQPWLDHIKKVLCSNNAECYEYYVKWLAWLIQRPDEKPGVGVLLQSDTEGTGKGIMNQLIKQIFGDHAIAISDSKHLLGAFNSHLASKIFVFMDESSWGGDKKEQGKMLSLITEHTATIEGKGAVAYEAASYLFFHVASNNPYPMHLSSSDRRWFMPNVSEKPHPEGRAYFDRLGKLLKDPEKNSARAFFRYLLEVDLDGFDIHKIPESDAKDRLTMESVHQSDPIKAFLFECYRHRHDTAQGYSAKPSETVLSAQIESDFLYFVSKTPAFQSLRRTGKILSAIKANNLGTPCKINTRTEKGDKDERRGWHFADVEDYKKALATLLGVSESYLDEE